MKTIVIANQKGGTGKTTTAVNMGVALAQLGYKVLMVDFDAQASMTRYLEKVNPDGLRETIGSLMEKEVKGGVITPGEGVRHTEDGVDIIPSNILLSKLEVDLFTAYCRESVLKNILKPYRSRYDYCVIDCGPTLGLLLVNALVAADSVIIPVLAEPLSIYGMEMLTDTIAEIQQRINPHLAVDGVVLTMTDRRTNISQEISAEVHKKYGGNLHIYKTDIPKNVRTTESSGIGHSVMKYDPKSKGAIAYANLTKEVLEHGKEMERDGFARY